MTNKTLFYILGGAVIYYYGYKYYQKNKPKKVDGVIVNSSNVPIEIKTETKCKEGETLVDQQVSCVQAPCPIIKSCEVVKPKNDMLSFNADDIVLDTGNAPKSTIGGTTMSGADLTPQLDILSDNF
jgi:hypothetical protein